MSQALLSSKVSIREEEPRVRTIDAIQTSIDSQIGITKRGPINTPTLVTSFEEYRDIYGGYSANAADMVAAVQGFFENEGQFLIIVRIVDFTDTTTGTVATAAKGTVNLLTIAGGPTAGTLLGTVVEPFDLNPGDTIIASVDGNPDDTATFDATPATATSSNTETYALADGQTLTFGVNGGPTQTATFNTAEFVAIGAATAAEVAAVINAEITGIQATAPGTSVIITTDQQGSGASLDSFGGTAAATLGFAGSAAGTGDVADIDAVTAAEVITLLEADLTGGSGVTVTAVGGAIRITSNTTGPASSIAVNATSTADTKLGFDNATHSGTTGAAVNTLQVDGKTEGAYANNLSTLVEAATSGVAEEFDFSILDDGLLVEIFANVTMVDTLDNYVEAVVNNATTGSNLVEVTDLDAAPASQRPANGTSATLSGGNDGLAGLADTDFGTSVNDVVGIQALNTIQDVNILTVPGRATAPVQNAMITYCENTRDGSMFAVLDPPAGSSATAIITYVETTALLLGLSEFGAMYWPRVKILNPDEGVFGVGVNDITVPPSGHVAGVYARTDGAREGGIYDPPAGIEEGQLKGVIGFETDEVFDEAKRDLVFPKRINILTSFTGAPRHIDGSRTLKGGGNFPFVAQRRGAIFIEQSIKNGTEFARNKNNTDKLRRTVERTIRGFLLIQMRNEAFASQDPDTAFFVDFSKKLNNAAVVNAGKMVGRVGLAFNTPAEFIIIRFSRDTRALEQELAS